jgi:hypothetical protein
VLSLLVAFKIRSTLPEACLDHVLTSQGKTLLECDALANKRDSYFANHTVEGRPKLVRSEFRARMNIAGENVHKSGIVDAGERGTVSANAQVNGPRDDTKGAETCGPSQPVSKGGLCFACHSPGHKQANFPSRKSTETRTGEARVATRLFRVQ